MLSKKEAGKGVIRYRLKADAGWERPDVRSSESQRFKRQVEGGTPGGKGGQTAFLWCYDQAVLSPAYITLPKQASLLASKHSFCICK